MPNTEAAVRAASPFALLIPRLRLYVPWELYSQARLVQSLFFSSALWKRRFEMKALASIVFLFLLIFGSAVAQQSPDLGVAADTAYQNKNWTQAEKLYSELVQSHAAVGRYWYRLGVSQHRAGHNDKALQTLES